PGAGRDRSGGRVAARGGGKLMARESSPRDSAAVRAWVRILSLQKHALAAIRDELHGDITLPRFDLLSNLVRQDGQTFVALSRSMLVTAGNLTGLVDRAER